MNSQIKSMSERCRPQQNNNVEKQSKFEIICVDITPAGGKGHAEWRFGRKDQGYPKKFLQVTCNVEYNDNAGMEKNQADWVSL